MGATQEQIPYITSGMLKRSQKLLVPHNTHKRAPPFSASPHQQGCQWEEASPEVNHERIAYRDWVSGIHDAQELFPRMLKKSFGLYTDVYFSSWNDKTVFVCRKSDCPVPRSADSGSHFQIPQENVLKGSSCYKAEEESSECKKIVLTRNFSFPRNSKKISLIFTGYYCS